jgi:hypothetical protein
MKFKFLGRGYPDPQPTFLDEETVMPVRRWFGPAPVVVMGVLILVAGRAPAEENASETRMRKDVFFLASDACEGRGVNTKGINLAADFIAKEFQQAGLKPGGLDGSYFQPFTMTGSARLGSPNALVLRGPLGQEIQLPAGAGFQPLGLSGAGKVTAPIVFVGYGATAKQAKYDDYQNMDVAGKVVVVLRKTPRPGNTITPFDGNRSMQHAALVTKLVNADLHKAAAVLFSNDQDTVRDQKSDRLMDFAYTANASGSTALPALHVHRDLVDAMLQASLGTSLATVEGEIDRTLKPRSAPLTGWTARMEVNVERTRLAVKNVVGVVEGAGPHARETVIVGAHYDHLGYGGPGSLARLNKPAIHHGADDNGSGTTALLELARRFGQQRHNRRLVFIAFSGEESGLLGSEYYCKHPLYPLADTVTMVNMDMVGRLRPDKDSGKDKLIVYGTGTSKGFDKLIDDLNAPFGFKLSKIQGGYGPSDHASFYAVKVPVFFFFTGDHADYHKPSDTADKVNVHGMRLIADLVEQLVIQLVNLSERPKYVKVAGGSGLTAAFSGPRLGIRPTYGDDKEGVLVQDVNGDGPAAKAGVKAGDRILELGGKPVKNVEAYMVLLANQKKGEAVEVRVLRDGSKITLKVTPQ